MRHSQAASRNTPPRVVAVDLDGTLLPLLTDGTQALTDSTVESAGILQQMGISVILVTGRMFRSAVRFALDMGLRGPIAAYQGALIRDSESGRLLHHDPVPNELTLEILSLLEPRGLTMNLYVDDGLYVAERNSEVERYEGISGMEAHSVGRLSAFLDRPTTKIGVSLDPSQSDALLAELRTIFGERVTAVKTWPFFLEVASPTATKARALAILGDMLDFDAHEVLAFGDSYNDADMLAWAGTGVAMAGAPPEVLAAADETCESVENDGFARYLMRQPWFPDTNATTLAGTGEDQA